MSAHLNILCTYQCKLLH